MFLTVLDSLTKLLVPPCDPELGGYNICDVKTMIIYVCFFILNLQLLSYGCLSNFNISCPGGGLWSEWIEWKKIDKNQEHWSEELKLFRQEFNKKYAKTF